MWEGLFTGPGTKRAQSVLYWLIFSGPVDCTDLVKFHKWMILLLYSGHMVSFGRWSRLVIDDCHRNFLCHDPLEPLLPALPIWHHSVQQFKEGCAVVRLSDVAKLVGDDVIDGVDRSFDKASVEQQAVRGRH